jgi:hypothetical protein
MIRSGLWTILFSALVASTTPLAPSAHAAGAPTTTTPCIDQCDTQWATCLYYAQGARNQCMVRCSMTLYPKRCYPACKQMYQQLTKDCAAADATCVAACP